MTDDHKTSADSAQKDLAFLRGLVNEAPKTQAAAGFLFIVGGLTYGVQCLAYWMQMAFKQVWPPLLWPIVSFSPTVIFLGFMGYVIWRDRKDTQHGVATRALNAGFGGVGLANLSMCVVFGYVSSSEKNFLIWLLYPAVTAALQGAAWYMAYMIRRRLWLAVVSGGWFAAAIALGFLIRDLPNYMLVLSAALFGLMAVPGYIMMRHGKAG